MKEAVLRGGRPLCLSFALVAGAEFAELVPGSIFVAQLKVQVTLCS